MSRALEVLRSGNLFDGLLTGGSLLALFCAVPFFVAGMG